LIISSAHAQATGAAPAGGDPLFSFGFIGLLFVLMYFLMIRPQMKKAKEHKLMVDALSKGDEVIAAGGILGKIVKISDNYATLEIANNTEIVVQRGAILNLLPKGTIKSI
jgi:preprotein translocase subunit YajC